jgi:hypothetical protein
MRPILALAFLLVAAVSAFTYRDILLRRTAPARAPARAVMRQVQAGPRTIIRVVSAERTTDPLALAVMDSIVGTYMRTIAENSVDITAMTDLAFLYMRHGWWDRALGPLARARDIDPESEPLRRYLELALARAGVGPFDLAQLARDFAAMAAEWGHGC